MPFSFDVSISLLGTMFVRFYAFHDFHEISMPFFGLVSVLILFRTAHGLAAGRLRRAELSTNASQKRVQSLRRCRPPADSIEWALRETCFMYRFGIQSVSRSYQKAMLLWPLGR